MHYFGILIFLLFFDNSIASTRENKVDGFGFGNIKIAMSKKEVLRILTAYKISEKSMSGEEGTLYHFLEIRKKDGSIVANLELSGSGDKSSISRMMLFDDTYTTAKGIGVGSTYNELKKQHGVEEIVRGDYHVGLPPLFNVRGTLVYTRDFDSVGFIFDHQAEDKLLDNSAKVKAIYIY